MSDNYQQFVIDCIAQASKEAEASICLGGRDLRAKELKVDDIVALQEKLGINFPKRYSRILMARHPNDEVIQSLKEVFPEDGEED